MSTRPAAAAPVAMLAAVALLAGCAGADGEADEMAPVEAEPAAAGEADSDPGDTGDDASPMDHGFDLGARIWHAGFLVEFTDGRLHDVEQPSGDHMRFLAINATFENLGAETSRWNPETVLSTGSGFLSPHSGGTELPSVPGGLAAEGRIVFSVQDEADFDLERASLIIGSARERQSIVPLGPQAGELITYEPQDVAISAEISLELVDVIVTGGQLRADRPVNYSQVGQDQLALTVILDAVSRRPGNWHIAHQDFALILPSGMAAVAEGSGQADGTPGLGTLPGSEEGNRTSGLYMRFVIDDPPSGTYTLRYTPTTGLQGDDSEGSAEFTLP